MGYWVLFYIWRMGATFVLRGRLVGRISSFCDRVGLDGGKGSFLGALTGWMSGYFYQTVSIFDGKRLDYKT